MRRHPVLILDSAEKRRPLAVEAFEQAAKLAPPFAGPVKLDSLPEGGGRMDLPSGPDKWAPALEEQFGNVGYLRRVEAGGLVWLQYWLLYLDNPKAYLGEGKHEGDWEMVQVGYAGDIPVCATGSTHHTGVARMWWDVREYQDTGRPIIYVARDSHANYLAPTDTFEDRADAWGTVLDAMEWRDLGPWAQWPGRWGNSAGTGMSPLSPGHQGDRWRRPHLFHSRASH